MDIISKVNLRVDDMELTHKVFTEGLEYPGNFNKMMTIYKMDSGSEVLVYNDSEIFRESPTHVRLIVSPEKITKVYQILKEAAVPYVIYHENVGEGVVHTLEWGQTDGCSLRLESVEDNYWETHN